MLLPRVVIGALLTKVGTCAISLSLSPAQNASKPLLESFVSYSIEFSSFPDFAGKLGNMLENQVITSCRQFQSAKYLLVQSPE